MHENDSRFWHGINVVTDTAWGDSGKGKIVDAGAQEADMVVRYNGGANAGHTVVNNRGEFKFHLVPSGIFNPEAICIMTGGVVIDPIILSKEIVMLEQQHVPVTSENLLIASNAHLVMPWHKLRDGYEELNRGEKQIGTTKQGIGPTYQDRVARKGLRMADLLRDDFVDLFEHELSRQLSAHVVSLDGDKILSELLAAREIISPMITNVLPIIHQYVSHRKAILGEGAQGALLDLDLGTYPFVTSSNPGLAGFLKTTAISHRRIDKVIGVTKAYTTRVGEGPLPTELDNEIGEFLRIKGNEFGATTGRPRRCGWLDLPAIKYGAMVGQVDALTITKLDVLDELSEVKVCIGYQIGSKQYSVLPDPEALVDAKPIYRLFRGWEENTSDVRIYDDLPTRAQNFIEEIEEWVKLPVEMVSVGPEREATIYNLI